SGARRPTPGRSRARRPAAPARAHSGRPSARTRASTAAAPRARRTGRTSLAPPWLARRPDDSATAVKELTSLVGHLHPGWLHTGDRLGLRRRRLGGSDWRSVRQEHRVACAAFGGAPIGREVL